MIDPGKLQLHDAATPALQDGRYRVTVTPTLAAGVVGSAPAAGAFEMEIGDPLSDPGVLAAHPADGATGGFGDELPFVILRSRTLPWQRPGFGQAGTPWLTVMVTREDPPAEARLAQDGALQCTDIATQTRLLARSGEVRLLSHIREVNAQDTAAMVGDDDGWQAVVVANRLPRTAGKWRASLVRLDDRADLLGGSPTLGLKTLFSWTFTVAGSGGFGARLAALNPRRFADPSALPNVVDPSGAVTISARDRTGRVQPGRYRSPLLPHAPGDTAVNGGADASQVPDLTATAAFQLGRLLAAADGRLLRELARLRAGAVQSQSRSALTATLAKPSVNRVFAIPATSGGPAPTPAPVTAQTLAAASVARWRRDAYLPLSGRFGSAAAGLKRLPGES